MVFDLTMFLFQLEAMGVGVNILLQLQQDRQFRHPSCHLLHHLLMTAKVKIQFLTGLPNKPREVRVFLSNDNVAIDKNATQSSNLNEDSHIASKAVDDKWRSWSSTDTSDLSVWWELDLGETLPVEKVISDNPNCSCKLSHAAISMFDDQGKLVASKTTKDTCSMW